ncbi:hypothetical protein IJT17_08205 [bacterium]|nr:hypothetical protein [bacterium]
MSNDYGYQASQSHGRATGDESENSGVSRPGGGINPFSVSRSHANNRRSVSPQSPFINAQQHSAPPSGASFNGRGEANTAPQQPRNSSDKDYADYERQSAPSYGQSAPNYDDYGQASPQYDYDQFDPHADYSYQHEESQPADNWSSEFDDFSRISQQQPMFNGRRNVADVFDRDQLKLYDQSKFSELHYMLQTKLSRHPKDKNTLLGIAICNLAIGEPKKSAEYFAKATDVDEAVRPSRFLNEIPTSDPDDWLDMAEELGHFGMIDGSMELCSSIVDSNQFSDRVRRQALKVREAIQQDYYAARERIIIGSNTNKNKEGLQSGRLFNNLALIIAPLMLAILMGSLFFYSINLNNGKQSLGSAIYRLEHLKRGDTAIERMGSCDNDLSDAADYLSKAKKFNPFSKEVYFLDLQRTLLTKELGRVRSRNEATRWDSERWQEVKDSCANAQTAYDNLGLSTEKDLEFKNEWQEFVIASKKEENSSI